MKISGLLYKLARMANDAEKATSGDLGKIARRGKNKLVGRILGPKIYGHGRRKK